VRVVRAASAATIVIALCALVGCAPEPSAAAEEQAPSTAATTAAPSTPASTPSPTPTTEPVVTFLSVVDGDTITTSAGTVRIIGIDTPERGECGHDEASTAIGRLLSNGDAVTLELPAGQNDTDRYDRLLRYVTTSAGVDLGLMQIEQGNAIARFDSTDGYPAHPKETAYHAAQIAVRSAAGTVVTTSCAEIMPAATPSATRAPSTDDAWWRQYSSCAKLKKNTVGDRIGPFDRDDPADAELYEWFAYGTGNNGDGDNDGLACE